MPLTQRQLNTDSLRVNAPLRGSVLGDTDEPDLDMQYSSAVMRETDLNTPIASKTTKTEWMPTELDFVSAQRY